MKSASPKLLGTSRRPTSRLVLGSMAAFAVAIVFSAIPLLAAGPRALSEGEVPKDARLAPPKDLNGYFPFTPSKSTEDWAKRAERVRRQILVSQGLWPMPTKTPLNAVVHGKVDRSDYTVERVYFESFPGFYVTGSLYRPKRKIRQASRCARTAWSLAQWPFLRSGSGCRSQRNRQRCGTL